MSGQLKTVPQLPTLLSPPPDALVPLWADGKLQNVTAESLAGTKVGERLGVFSVLDYAVDADALRTGAEEPVDAFAAACAAAAGAAGGTVFVPKGTYGTGAGWYIDLPSGVTIEGVGDGSVLLNCHLTASGSAGAEIPFTAPAAKGAASISIPATGLTNAWLRIASVINCQSTDAGADQLGDRAADRSYFAEFVQVKAGLAGSATLFKGTEFAYSNTPGPDSGTATTSVARVVSFHSGGAVRNLSFSGRNTSFSEILLGTFCRDLRIEHVSFDTNDASCYAVAMLYCLDCTQTGGSVRGKLTGISASTENILFWGSCTNCYADGVDSFGGYQAFDVTYPTQDPYRGGPSIDCGAVRCTAEGYQVDGFTSHGGCLRSFFDDCDANGGANGANGFRIRSRGDRVSRCKVIGWGSSGAGVKIHEAALFDCDVTANRAQGMANGIEFDCSATTFAALRALLNGSRAQIAHNILSDLTANGIALLASPALATMIGPHVHHNQIFSPGGDGIDVGSYINGAVLEANRINGIPAGARGIRWTTNIKRLFIGEHYIYGVDASGFAAGGASVVNQITDTTTFPAGNSEAQLFVGRINTDATTPFTGIFRDTTGVGYVRQQVAGWQPSVQGLSPSEPTLSTEALMAFYFSGTEMLAKSLDAAGTTTRRYALPLRGAGSPEGVVTAPVSTTYVRTDGGASTTFYVKESGSGNTGWVAK